MTETNSAQAALVGKKLGDYELTSILAAGGMARIYKGIDSHLDRIAAVKVLMRELLENDDSLTERFKQEAKAIAKLEHPNIIPIYQFNEQDGYFFIAMKYVEGEDLADQLARQRAEGHLMDKKRVFHIMEQVAAALDYAHRHDIIHRDVKPSNILIDRDDHAYLTDFGLALWQSVNKTMGTAFGTPRYISPEQALASEKSVPQSDIYSLAVVMYEILTGDMLFRADTPMQIALYHINEPPPRPRDVNPDIPVAAERELLKALSKAPHKRHSSASEFIGALKAAYVDQMDSDTAPIPSAISHKTLVLTPTDDARDNLKATATGATAWGETMSRPEGRMKRRRFSLPIFIGVLIALALTAGGVYLFATGAISLNLTPEPTLAPTQAAVVQVDTPTPTPPPPLEGEAVSLRYDYTTFVLRSASEQDIPLEGVRFVRAGETPITFEGTQVTGAKLPSERCVVLIQSGREPNFRASDWGCFSGGGGRVYWQTSVQNGGAFFWRVEADVNRFEVYVGDTLAAVCGAVTRTHTPQTCDFNLPID